MKAPPQFWKYRWLLIGSALLGLAALLIDRNAATDAPPPPSPAARTEASRSTPMPDALAKARAPLEGAGPLASGTAAGEVLDIFAVRTWDPPVPVPDPAIAAAPPPPEPPALPFRYAGRLEEPGKPPIFFILRGEKVLAVHPGELINSDYRVGKIEGGQLHFTYRPMNIRQSIPVGGDT